MTHMPPNHALKRIPIRNSEGHGSEMRSFSPHEGIPASNVMITSAIPVIAVSDSARSEDYYCRVLGFQRMFAYRPDPSKSDPCYLGVARDGVWLHLPSFKRERAAMTDTLLWVRDVDLLHVE